MNVCIWAALGTGFTFLMTVVGAAIVFCFGKTVKDKVLNICLGFAAGVMIAASVWSLLIPAIEDAAGDGVAWPWVPAAGGFVMGVLFLLLLDFVLPHFHPETGRQEGMDTVLKRSTLLVLAVTLHNIPEGMAVGLAFALAAQHYGEETYLAAAFALALGIGIQNLPEGAAVSLPLRQSGMSRGKSFLIGSCSGFVEPLFGISVTLAAVYIEPFMPWMLSFAAGAMMFVVIEELIPEAHLGTDTNWGTLGALSGFLVMMILDVALG